MVNYNSSSYQNVSVGDGGETKGFFAVVFNGEVTNVQVGNMLYIIHCTGIMVDHKHL